MLFVRALLAFLLLPGIVAFLGPALVLDPPPWARPFDLTGLVLLVPGLVLLIWCVVAFYHVGRGTLAPWDPPRALVVSGVYAVSRNPMYVAVVLVLLGWAAGFRSAGLVVYTCIVATAFHVRVLVHEEPFLLRTHGDEWTRYRAQVPRWLGAPRSAAARRTLAWLAAGAAMSVGTPVYLAFAHGLEGYLLHPTLILAQAAPYLVAGAFWLPCRTPPLPRAGTWTAIVMFAAALVIYVPMLTGIVSTGGDMVALAFMAIDAVTLAVLVLSIVLVHAVVFVRRRGRLPASRSR